MHNRFFSVQQLLHEEPELAPAGGGTRKGSIECEFCKCSLTPTGELKSKLSPRARELRDLESNHADTIAEKDRKIKTLTDDLALALAELKQLKETTPPAPASKRRGWSDADLLDDDE